MRSLALADIGGKVQVTRRGNAISPVLQGGETQDEWLARLAKVVGSTDNEIAEFTLVMLSSALGRGDDIALNAILAQLQEMEPKNAIERCLIIQMLLTSYKSIQALAASSGSILQEEIEAKVASAIRFMRLYLQQCEVFRKLRNGGNQTITINHMSVDKAVIGNPALGRG